MRTRVPVAVLAAAACLAPPAHAQGRACHLLGASERGAGKPTVEPSLAIRSADVASDGRNVTAVVRVASLDGPTDAATGRYYAFFFSLKGRGTFSLGGTVWATGARFVLGRENAAFDPPRSQPTSGAFVADAGAVLDGVRDEVRITVPLATLRRADAAFGNGARLTYLAAYTDRIYGAPSGTLPVPQGTPSGIGFSGDFVYGSDRVTYRMGTPSCVPVGK